MQITLNIYIYIYTNTIEVQMYDLTYEYSSTLKTKPKTKKNTNSWCSPQMDERISYEEFSTNMKKLNDEQRFCVDDIVYLKNIYPSKPLHIFLIEV